MAGRTLLFVLSLHQIRVKFLLADSFVTSAHLQRAILFGLAQFVLLGILGDTDDWFGPGVSFGVVNNLLIKLDWLFAFFGYFVAFSHGLLIVSREGYRLQSPLHLSLLTP